MSMETWMQEFYPVAANKVSKEDALAHSLKKWEGLRQRNLKKHGMRQSDEGYSIHEWADSDHRMNIDSESCALCQHYMQNLCARCPLAEVRYGIPCDRNSGVDEAPYQAFVKDHTPEPMIWWLEKAMKESENEQH